MSNIKEMVYFLIRGTLLHYSKNRFVFNLNSLML